MNDSRTKNSKRNIISGIIYRITSIVFPFIIRTAIIYVLGEQYAGLSSLFTSILQVLNLTELGFSAAVVYNLYKPIAEDDTDTICAILSYYRKVYFKIGMTILLLGIILMPFLPRLIKGTWPQDINIYVLFIIYLINTSLSYFLYGYKSSLLYAMQRIDLTNVVSAVAKTSQHIIELIVLLVFKNYYLYCVIAIISTISINLYTAHICNSKYPRYQCKGTINRELKKSIGTQVKGVMIGKIGDTARNSFDSIIISSFIGLTAVTIYNNYYYIYDALYSVMLIIIRSVQASVGNSIAVESTEKNYKDLNKFTFIIMWITGWCSICLLCLYQPFMLIWMKGKADMMLPFRDMVLFSIYFYAINMNDTRNLYVSGCGLYPQCKQWFIIEAAGNLLLNLVLGKIYGITGVIIATILTIIVFNFIARTNVLFKEYFKTKSTEFYSKHLLYIFTTILAALLTYFICHLIDIGGLLGLVFKLMICVIVPNTLYGVVYHRTNSFKEAMRLCVHFLKKG